MHQGRGLLLEIWGGVQQEVNFCIAGWNLEIVKIQDGRRAPSGQTVGLPNVGDGMPDRL